MIEMTLRVPIQKEFDLGKIIKIERAQPYDEKGGKALLRVGEKSEDKIRAAISSPNVLRVDLSETRGDTIASIVLDRCKICRLLEDSFLMEARKEKGDSMLWKILVPDPSSFSIDRLKDLKAEVVSIIQLTEKPTLTENEDKVLRVAFDMGYFEVPRKARIRDIARRLGKSPSTVNETLRRAEKKILEKCVEG